MHRHLLTFALVVAPLASAHAQFGLSPMPGEQQLAGVLPQDQSQTVGAGLGFGAIDEDFFLKLVVATELNLGPVGLGLQVPLNLRVWDKDPKNNDDYYGLLRHEDWDQPSDYIKVIRYVRLGHKRDSFYLRVGEIAPALGHGTIMNRYINNLDPNTFRVGSEFDINTDYGGFETVVSSLGTLYDTKDTSSRILGLRLYAKPWAFIDPESVMNRLSIGASIVADTNAPKSYVETTLPIGPSDRTYPVMDENGQYEIATDTTQTVYGFDAEFEVLHSAMLDIVPYTDFNKIDRAGWGWHAGVLVTAKMPIGFDLTIPVRLEYRRFSSNYVPAYFSTFYEIERFAVMNGGAPTPKSTWVRALDGGEGLNGYYGELAFDFAGLVQVGAVYEDYESTDPAIGPNLQAFAKVPALEWLQFKAFYARTNIQGSDDVFKFDDRSMAVVEGRYEVYSYIFLVGRLTRHWVLVTDTTKDNYGTYEGVNDWNVGVEASLTF